MSTSRRDDTPDPFSSLLDEHYDNEQSSRRRRLNESSRLPRSHYPGDGLDFRRPVMSTSSNARAPSTNARSNPVVIDLTDEDGARESQGSERSNALSARNDRAPAASSRAHRLPRWGRDLIDFESSDDEEEDQDTSQLPGARYLALPGTRRPHRSTSRRHALEPSPLPDMDDDIEVLTTNTIPRPRQRTASRRSTPTLAQLRHPPRSVTPHLTSFDQPIDLTQDDDEEVIHIGTAQRGGVNRERPTTTANVGTRSLAERGFGVGNIANIIQRQGVDIGGRLMQRLGAFAGLDQELRAQQQAFDQFNHNHGHRHAHRPAGGAAAAPALGNLGGLRMGAMNGQGAMPIMMNYGMTAFDMGIEERHRPPTPKYSPPPEPEAGFTRSPLETEVVVCPNCGDELAMGDSDLKQEVWVIKSCGHVCSIHLLNVLNTSIVLTFNVGVLRRMCSESKQEGKQEGQRQDACYR